jgi:two-component system, NtrC family, sensor kinase
MSNRAITKSLQEKVSLTLFAVITVLAILSYLVLYRVVLPAFDQLELQEARTNLVRAERAIQNDLDNLSAITGDWGLWDDAYEFVRGENPAFRASNLDRPTLTNLNLNLLAVYDVNARLIWGQVQYDGSVATPEKLGVLNPGTDTATYLITHTNPEGQTDGMIMTDLGPMMISSWPVVRSDGSGPIVGTMIMGQFLDKERAASLRERTEVRLGWIVIDRTHDFEASLTTPMNLARVGTTHYETTDSEVVSSGLLVDLFNAPLLELRVRTPRRISALGNSTVDGALAFLALAAVIVAIVTWYMLRKIIVLPLAGLAKHISSIRKSGDLTHRLGATRRDEIGALACEFDKLTEELHAARKSLLDQSFRAGKADTAAEVMHNIRNAMTPLINGIDRVRKNFTGVGKLRIQKAVDELTDPDCPPDRAEKLFRYIESAFSHIVSGNERAAENLNVVSRQARQVAAILADQEKHAHVAPVIEKLNLDEVLDEAVLVIPQVDEPMVALDLEADLSELSVRAHRVGLLQVMGNLILNAFESIQRSNSADGRIELTACRETVDAQQMIRLTITDTGCGFDESTREKIFQRGYSSKDGQLSGLGLHWCANALAAMGGRIRAESTGPGHGAEFHVLLPAAQGGLM